MKYFELKIASADRYRPGQLPASPTAIFAYPVGKNLLLLIRLVDNRTAVVAYWMGADARKLSRRFTILPVLRPGRFFFIFPCHRFLDRPQWDDYVKIAACRCSTHEGL